MAQFWWLRPPSSDDYRRVFVNGSARAIHRLPAVGCSTCARTRSSGRVLPMECPEDPALLPMLTPRIGREHRLRPEEFEELIAKIGHRPEVPMDMLPLRPGDSYQPLLLTLPSRPETDFLWPGVGTVFVSARVRALWEELGVSGVAFATAKYEKIGRRSPAARLVTRGGEPERRLREAEPVPDGVQLPEYWVVTVTGISDLPPGADAANVCQECGIYIVQTPDQRELTLSDRIWRGSDVTLLASTQLIAVTDRVKRSVESIGATNVVFSPADSDPDIYQSAV